ncbi:MAG: 4Fe-4S binding protein [Bacteriovoracaceae bacterium]|nr:4Fe-4S binding protein [Bacteriovoracaceae bacterium]
MKVEDFAKTHRRIDYLRIFLFIAIFLVVGIVVSLLRDNSLYLLLFTSIGSGSAIVEFLKMYFPDIRQHIRITFQIIVGASLLIFLTYGVGVNFQFSQLFFDASGGVVTGALIQLLVARIIIPLFYGNMFCSQVCWSGVAFELMKNESSCNGIMKPRSNFLAWGYLLLVVMSVLVVSQWWNPATNGIDIKTGLNERRLLAFGEIIFVFFVSYVSISHWGSRSYCRLLCPFITISGVISRFSLYKIRPVLNNDCVGCGECDRACQMNVKVSTSILNKEPINDSSCILCERCVSACEFDCLEMAPFKFKKK